MALDEPVPDWMLQALRYVDLLDEGGVAVSDAQLDIYVATPQPNRPWTSASSGLNGYTTAVVDPSHPSRGSEVNGHRRGHVGPELAGSVIMPDHSVSDYLRQVGWIAPFEDAVPRLTPLGKALVTTYEARAAARVVGARAEGRDLATGRHFSS